MDTKYFSTQQVAQMLNVKVNRLQRAIWDGRIEPPIKSPGRSTFLWVEDDINRASWVLRGRNASDIFDRDLPDLVKQEMARTEEPLEVVNSE